MTGKYEEPAPITADTWTLFPGTSQLYYTYVNFDGFSKVNNYDGDANSDYVFQNISINGTSIYDIRANTDVSGWTWEAFPQSSMAQFQKPVIGCIEQAGKLQLRIHKNYYDKMIAEYGALEISVNAGFILNGFVNKTEIKLVKTSGGTYVTPTVVDAGTVSVSRWQPLTDKQLTYFNIKYSAFPQLDYGELNGSIHFHALIYIPEGEMIGELVKKREYSTKRGERRTRYGNTFFDEYFGMSDFQEVNPILLKRGGTSRYLVKYIMKSGEKALYSRGTPAEICKELSDNDIVGTYLDYVTMYVLWDDVLDWERDIKDYGKKKRLRV